MPVVPQVAHDLYPEPPGNIYFPGKTKECLGDVPTDEQPWLQSLPSKWCGKLNSAASVFIAVYFAHLNPS